MKIQTTSYRNKPPGEGTGYIQLVIEAEMPDERLFLFALHEALDWKEDGLKAWTWEQFVERFVWCARRGLRQTEELDIS